MLVNAFHAALEDRKVILDIVRGYAVAVILSGGMLHGSMIGKLLADYRRAAFYENKRFWNRVIKTKSCWLWDGGLDQRGYGFFAQTLGEERQTLRAHRVSYYLKNGPIPEGMFVCHTCDVPRCVNPDHLFLGTATENNQDKIAKGRHRGWSKEAILSGISEEEANFLKRKYERESRRFKCGRSSLHGETA